jgi:CubicO group peptidase (beta-lactamase class C family)
MRVAWMALTVGLLACGGAPPTSSPPVRFVESDVEYVFSDPNRRRLLEAALPSLDALAATSMREEQLPGLVLGAVIDGDLAYGKGFGFANIARRTRTDVDTVYRLGSVTKSFTALAALALRDAGMLSLEDPLTRFLPEASGLIYPTHDASAITLRQLLTHTSGGAAVTGRL